MTRINPRALGNTCATLEIAEPLTLALIRFASCKLKHYRRTVFVDRECRIYGERCLEKRVFEVGILWVAIKSLAHQRGRFLWSVLFEETVADGGDQVGWMFVGAYLLETPERHLAIALPDRDQDMVAVIRIIVGKILEQFVQNPQGIVILSRAPKLDATRMLCLQLARAVARWFGQAHTNRKQGNKKRQQPWYGDRPRHHGPLVISL